MENIEERSYLRDTGGEGRAILIWILKKKGLQNFVFIHLAWDGVQLRILVKILISIFS
jgi:cytochrome c oxidase subunit IV